jgi:hypothetical protein
MSGAKKKAAIAADKAGKRARIAHLMHPYEDATFTLDQVQDLLDAADCDRTETASKAKRAKDADKSTAMRDRVAKAAEKYRGQNLGRETVAAQMRIADPTLPGETGLLKRLRKLKIPT